MAGVAGDSGGGNAFDAKSMSAFKSGLNRIYTFYTGGFLAFVIVLAILEQMGLSRSWIGFVFLLATIGLYAGIGIMSRTTDASEYYV
ncbi:MAG: cation acetate symporter, partial [Burkholderiales bacterium]